MRDFKSFQKNNYTSNPQNSKNAMDMLSAFAKKYEGASQSEIISAIIEEAERGKRNGTLTNQEIDNFANMIRPMLNASQKEQLTKIINRIKNL